MQLTILLNLRIVVTIRVANKKNGVWAVNQWVKKAILLSFRINKNDDV